jgi:hypothetical protein
MHAGSDMKLAGTRLGVELALSVAYFLAPAFIVSVLTLGILFWTTIGYVLAYGGGIGVVVAIPVWIIAKLAFGLHQRAWFGVILFAVTGATTAVLAIALMDVLGGAAFAPFQPFEGSALAGTIVVTVYAGACTCLGWLTVYLHRAPTPYEDALRGLDFAQLICSCFCQVGRVKRRPG